MVSVVGEDAVGVVGMLRDVVASMVAFAVSPMARGGGSKETETKGGVDEGGGDEQYAEDEEDVEGRNDIGGGGAESDV